MSAVNALNSTVNVGGAGVGLAGAISVGGAIPIVGAAIAAFGVVFSAIMAGHEQRLAEAKNENAANNAAVSGFDADLKKINAAYNSGGLSDQDAVTLLNQIWANYWALVGKYIQPGRNGCNSGQNCLPPSQPKCSGNYGAACCVGCSDIQGAYLDSIQAIQHGGGTITAKAVGASKYGEQFRAAYTLTWQHPGTGSRVPPPSIATPAPVAAPGTVGGFTTPAQNYGSTFGSAVGGFLGGQTAGAEVSSGYYYGEPGTVPPTSGLPSWLPLALAALVVVAVLK